MPNYGNINRECQIAKIKCIRETKIAKNVCVNNSNLKVVKLAHIYEVARKQGYVCLSFDPGT